MLLNALQRGRPRVLHRNLLLLLQGRIRQEGGVGGKGGSDSKDKDETPKVARTPCERSWRTTKPHVNATQQVDTSVVLSDENTHSMMTSPSSPESRDEDSSEDEEYITPIPSNTTASGSATTDIPPSTDGDIQLVSDVPYPEESISPDQATDNVSIDSEPDSDTEPSDSEHDNKSPAQTAPRRKCQKHQRCTSPLHYGKAYKHSTVISELLKPTRYKQTLYVLCYQWD